MITCATSIPFGVVLKFCEIVILKLILFWDDSRSSVFDFFFAIHLTH